MIRERSDNNGAHGRFTAVVGRRALLSRSLQAAAGMTTFALVGGALGDKAYGAGTCFPPYGRYCSGCDYYGNCDGNAGYMTCDTSNGCGNPACTYANGYWLSSCTSGTQVICRDCQRTPFCDSGSFCGCRGQKQISC